MHCSSFSQRGGLDELGIEFGGEIQSAMESCSIPTKERPASKIRNQVRRDLVLSGWSGEFPIDPIASGVAITSIKDRAGLCIQIYHMVRGCVDVLKPQKLYLDEKVQVGALVLRTRVDEKRVDDNIANTDRLQSKLSVFKKAVHMPNVTFSFE